MPINSIKLEELHTIDVADPDSILMDTAISNIKNAHVNSFLYGTSDHLLSLISSDIVRDKFFNENLNDSSVFKHSVYREAFPDMEFRHKKTGFEDLEDLNFELRKKFEEVLHKNTVEFVDNNLETVNQITPKFLEERHQFLQDFSISKRYISHYRKYKYKSFLEVCEEFAVMLTEIAEKNNRRPVLLYSGGLDSEYMVRIFQKAGLDFDTVTFNFKSGSNQYEMDYVYKFLEANPDINATIIDIDIEELWKGDYLNNACLYTGFTSPMLLAQYYFNYYVVTQMNGLAIAAGECRISKQSVELGEDNMLTLRYDGLSSLQGAYQWNKQPSAPGCPLAPPTGPHWNRFGFGPCFQVPFK